MHLKGGVVSLCPPFPSPPLPPPPPPPPTTAPVTLCPLQGPAKAAKGCRLMKTDGTVPQCVSVPTMRCALGLQSAGQSPAGPEPLQSDTRTPGTNPVRRTYTRNRSSQTHAHREPLQSDARVPGTAPVRRTYTGTPSFCSKVDALSSS